MCMCAAGTFANSSAGSPLLAPSGAWLGSPVAVLQSVVAGKPTVVLLKLSEPRYDAGKHSLTFHVRTCPGNGHACCMSPAMDSHAAAGVQPATAASQSTYACPRCMPVCMAARPF